MKSIKEKAKNYNGSLYTEAIFEAGANYVLEVVETILEDKDLDVEETYDKIRTTIKQLKK